MVVDFIVYRAGPDRLIEAVDVHSRRVIGDISLAYNPKTQSYTCAVDIPQLRDRQQGIGARLYYVAFEVAEKEGKTVRSDVRRSPFAEAVWRKHERTGHARCVRTKTGGTINMPPVDSAAAYLCRHLRGKGAPYVACKDKARAELLRKLPAPEATPRGPRWPCRYWASTGRGGPWRDSR